MQTQRSVQPPPARGYRVPEKVGLHDRVYSSNLVARICGVSLRQLQWWDERGYITPVIEGHSRTYTLAHLMRVRMASILKQRGGMNIVFKRLLVRRNQHVIDKAVDAALDPGNSSEALLIFRPDDSALFRNTERDAIRDMLGQFPVFVIDLKVIAQDLIKRLA